MSLGEKLKAQARSVIDAQEKLAAKEARLQYKQRQVEFQERQKQANATALEIAKLAIPHCEAAAAEGKFHVWVQSYRDYNISILEAAMKKESIKVKRHTKVEESCGMDCDGASTSRCYYLEGIVFWWGDKEPDRDSI